jgi:26S proteasome regulatory subunit N2
LADLTHKGGDDYLKALQIAFDLASSGTQEFLHNVQVNLPSPPDFPKIQQPTEEQDLPDPPSTQPSAAEITNLHKILSGELTIGMNLDFLYRTNKTDTVILNRIRDSLESRNSIFHNALSISNAFTHAGTTIDTFIRDNLEWLGRATNWSKFAATAALGVIHKGHLSQGRKLLEPYLPGTSGATSSAFTEGGSLYALGLIFANHGGKVSEYLLKQLQEANDEVVQHGAALGIGVAGLATADPSTPPTYLTNLTGRHDGDPPKSIVQR